MLTSQLMQIKFAVTLLLFTQLKNIDCAINNLFNESLFGMNGMNFSVKCECQSGAGRNSNWFTTFFTSNYWKWDTSKRKPIWDLIFANAYYHRVIHITCPLHFCLFCPFVMWTLSELGRRNISCRSAFSFIIWTYKLPSGLLLIVNWLVCIMEMLNNRYYIGSLGDGWVMIVITHKVQVYHYNYNSLFNILCCRIFTF